MLRLVSYALLWAAAGQSAGLKDPFANLPEVVEVVPIAGQLESVGVPVVARVVRTRLKPEAAQQWVAQSFRREGLYIPRPEKQFQLQGAPQLTGYDPKARRTYTAIFKANPDGSTTVVVGTADVSQALVARPKLALPVFPGSTHAVESSSEVGATISYRAHASQAELDSFYSEVLGTAGWVRDEEARGWVKGGQLLTVTRTPHPDGDDAVSVLLRGTGGGP